MILDFIVFLTVLQFGLLWLQLDLLRQQKRVREENLQLLEHIQRTLHGMRDRIGETIEDGDNVTNATKR